MFEFWHNFLHDAGTFGATMWFLFVIIVFIVMFYCMGRDLYK